MGAPTVSSFEEIYGKKINLTLEYSPSKIVNAIRGYIVICDDIRHRRGNLEEPQDKRNKGPRYRVFSYCRQTPDNIVNLSHCSDSMIYGYGSSWTIQYLHQANFERIS